MTEHKPLTTNELKANYGIVDGVPTYQDFYEAKDVRSAYKGLLSTLEGNRDRLTLAEAELLDSFEDEMEKWFPVFAKEKEGED